MVERSEIEAQQFLEQLIRAHTEVPARFIEQQPDGSWADETDSLFIDSLTQTDLELRSQTPTFEEDIDPKQFSSIREATMAYEVGYLSEQQYLGIVKFLLNRIS